MKHLVPLGRLMKWNMCFRSLFMNYGIDYWFYKESAKFSEMNRFHCVQWLVWGGRYTYWTWEWNMKSEESIDSKNSENWFTHVQVIPFWTNVYLSRPYTLNDQFKACLMHCRANWVYSMSSWTKLHLNGLETVLLIQLKKGQSPIYHVMSKPSLFQS